MAQHARPKVMGHMLDSRAQLIACSSDVVMTISSKRPSSQPMYVLAKTCVKRSLPILIRARDDSLTGKGRWLGALRGQALRGDAPYPVEVTALPQVREAD